MPHYAPTPPSQPLDLWMPLREIRSVSGILSLLTPSSLPPTSRSLSHLLWVPLSWLTIRTTRTSNLLQHLLPSPPLSSLYNKTFNSLYHRSLVTKTNFSLSPAYRQQKVTSVRRLSHFLVIPTSQLLSRKCVGRFAFPCHPRQKIPLPAVSLPLLRFDRVLEAAKPSMALSGSPPRLPMLTKILSIYSSRTSLSSPTLKASTAKSRAMSTPLLLMNTLFAGCEPRLPGSLNAMKGINLLSHLASMPFSAAISLFLRKLNLSKPDTAMKKSPSNSCATSFATTKWSCAFHDSLTPFMLCSHNRHSQAGFSPLQHRPLHISPHCQRALNSTLPLLHNSTNLPLQEVKLRRGLLPRLLPPLYLKVSLLGRFLLPPPANSLPARPIPLLLPFAHQ